MLKKYKQQQLSYIYAICFSAFLLTTFIGFLSMALYSAGPIIVGTEMNTNGMVEYLCLGNGCNQLQDMDW